MTAQPTLRAHWGHGRGARSLPKIARVAYALAQELGCRPKTAAHYLDETAPRAAALVRVLRRLGDHEKLARFLATIRAAETGDDHAVLTDALAREATQSAHEDCEAILAYEQCETSGNRRLLLRCIDHELAELTRLRAAVEREQRAL